MSAPTVIVGGKYTFTVPAGDYQPHILRHGEPWVVIGEGCNAVVSLMYAADEARTAIAAIESATSLEAVREIIATYKRGGQ